MDHTVTVNTATTTGSRTLLVLIIASLASAPSRGSWTASHRRSLSIRWRC
jgi:hypothetical protein